MTQQKHQFPEVDEMPVSNLDWAGQRFRQQKLLFKFPGTAIGKEQYF
jgi:hypothetical protein